MQIDDHHNASLCRNAVQGDKSDPYSHRPAHAERRNEKHAADQRERNTEHYNGSFFRVMKREEKQQEDDKEHKWDHNAKLLRGMLLLLVLSAPVQCISRWYMQVLCEHGFRFLHEAAHVASANIQIHDR